MRRLTHACLPAMVLLVVSCNPISSGPDVPRPTETAALTSSTTIAPTTSMAEPLDESEVCPTAFCLVYHIDSEAAWSDGDPVTAADFAHTVALHKDRSAAGDLSGYQLVESVDILDEKTARLVFTRPYGAWQTMFDRVFRDGEAVGALNDGLATAGPFTFVGWEEGESLTIERDRTWWASTDPQSGDPLGDVSEIRFVFIDTLEEMVDALGAGEVDVISARPDEITVAELAEMEGVDSMLAPGPFWEHIDFHHDDPILSNAWARQAISLAIDREKILDRTVRLIDPGAETLDSTTWMGNTPAYEPHFEDGFDPERAREILADNGCVQDDAGTQVCQGRTMSFVWASTSDDPARREAFESVREDLEQVGIVVTPVFRSPSAFVTRDFLFGGPGVWQLVNFSWRARPDPRSSNATYYCDDAGDLNVNRYCSQEVEELVRATETEVDPADRVALYNRADRLYLEDFAVIPLYQKPTMMAWTDQLTGPEPNWGLSSDLWNLASWSGKSSIVVALPAEPAEIDPLSRADDNANVILGPLTYGAFGMTPSHEFVPLLVESVDVIEGEQ